MLRRPAVVVESAAMPERAIVIQPVYPWEVWSIGRMSYANMIGVDHQFTTLARRRVFGPISRATFPFYLLLAGRGRKAVINGQVAGYAFLHLRRLSGVIFNVSVNRPFRRQGTGETLLRDLETIIRRAGRSWAALQVDWDNRPARALYEKLGYRTVHAHVWSGAPPPATVESIAAVEALPLAAGRERFRRYLHIELANGECWAAGLLREEYGEIPSEGRFWLCLRGHQEVGCAWAAYRNDQLLCRLCLAPDCWSDPALTAGLLHQMTSPFGPGMSVYVRFGSSEHHAGAAATMRDLGFIEDESARIMMLKELSA